MDCVLHHLSDCLFLHRVVDAAVAESDPLRRIAFVAAFAMSNYSSTIGRIAKPFNPMLVSSEYQAMVHGCLMYVYLE